MSYFDDASLVMIPSGYKTSKVYSVKPTDGTGDLAFTRSNDTATRVGPDGLIEKVRTNLVLQSNTFSTTWGNDDSTETSGQAGYDGTNNAWLLTKSAANGRIGQVLSVSGSATFSIYAKAGTDSWLRMASSDANVNAYFDLGTGSVGTIGSGTSAKITSVGNGWYRCSISGNASFTYFNIWVADADNDTSGTSGNILIQAAQLETGDIATPYIATTTAAVSVGPVANVPRLDYLNSSCPRLLLEPQRTNNALYSEQLDNAAWTKQNTTVTANAVTSPSGYQDADKLVETSATGVHRASVSSAATLNGTYSFFAKSGERTKVAIFSTTIDLGFDLSNGTLIDLGSGTSAGKIENYGNGWYRCSLPQASGIVALALALLDNANNVSYTGNGTSGAYFWGVQLETGAYATSYIPTLGAAVTRSSDVCNKTSVASLIGQTEGTLFAEVSFDDIGAGGGSAYVYFTDGSFANAVIVGREPASPNSKFFFYIQASSVIILNNTTNNITSGVVKMAIAYKSGDWAAYLNGNLVASGSTTFTFNASMSRIGIGTNDGAIAITGGSTRAAQALLFKTRLTNADLAALTA